jgi:hypothetical protein
LGFGAPKPSPGGRWIFQFAPWKGKLEKTDEGLFLEIITLISQKSKIFDSFSQEKPWALPRQRSHPTERQTEIRSICEFS